MIFLMLSKKTTLLLLKILEKITSDSHLHSKWLNTLSYLEYIGTRKMLKALPAHTLNERSLEHIHEEARHSLFFKRLAKKQSSKKEIGFTEKEMIASQSASDYFQKIDHYLGKFLFSNPVLNYLYTTYIIEQRALVVYSLYDEVLKRKSFSFSIQSILNDEKDHLAFVFKEIQQWDPLWENHLEEVRHFEHKKYFSLLIAFEREAFDIPFIKHFPHLNKDYKSPYQSV